MKTPSPYKSAGPFLRWRHHWIQFTCGHGTNHGHIISWLNCTYGQLSFRLFGTRWFGLHFGSE